MVPLTVLLFACLSFASALPSQPPYPVPPPKLPGQLPAPKTPSNSSIPLNSTIPRANEICSSGGRKLVLDAKSLRQTLQWHIGEIHAAEAPIICRSTVSMDYDDNWQYAVTKVNWQGAADIRSFSQALIVLTWAFGTYLPKGGGPVS